MSIRITKVVLLGARDRSSFLADALTMADNVMTYKQVVKEIAMKYGVYASFMPKPLSDAPGSGMHVHQSLFDEKEQQRVL